MTNSRGRTTPKGWPPRWVTKVPAADIKRGDGDRYSDFAEALCRITKDTVAGPVGSPLVLRDWQRKLLGSLLARKANGRRRHRTALIGMARKNGKTALGASLALAGTLLEADGAEVYACAGDREQARLVFGTAKRMIELEPELEEVCKLYRDAIEIPGTGSVFRVLSSEAPLKEGLSPTLVIFDELHVQPDDELWNVMNLGSGARIDPLVMAITTAGVRTDSLGSDTVCYRLYQHGQRVVRGEIDDPTFFFAWWEPKAGADADHTNPSVWKEANPGYGDLIDPEDFASVLPKTPESEFRTKRTNVFVSSTETALPHGAWDKCAAAREISPTEPIILALDGSWSGDSTGLVACTIEDNYLDVMASWEAEDDQPHWRVNLVDVRETVRDLCLRYNVREVAFDPFRMQQLAAELDDEGIPMVEFPNSAARMIPAWQSFYDATMDKRLHHSGDPRLTRHIANMVLKRDARGVRPVKESKTTRRHIDLGVCAVIAYQRANAQREPEAPPVVFITL